MHVQATSGSGAGALSIIGTGLALALPEQRWIGFILIALGVSAFLFDIKIEGWRLRVGNPWIKGPRMLPVIGMVLFGTGFISCAAWYFLSPQKATPDVADQPKPAETIAVSPNPISPSPSPTTQSSEREFTNKTPRQLLAFYEGRTPLQADSLMQPYKGLWIKAQGKVLTVLPDGLPGASIAVLKDGNDTIECRFGQRWNNQTSRVDEDDTLKVWGKISAHQNGSQLYLLECEIQ